MCMSGCMALGPGFVRGNTWWGVVLSGPPPPLPLPLLLLCTSTGREPLHLYTINSCRAAPKQTCAREPQIRQQMRFQQVSGLPSKRIWAGLTTASPYCSISKLSCKQLAEKVPRSGTHFSLQCKCEKRGWSGTLVVLACSDNIAPNPPSTTEARSGS